MSYYVCFRTDYVESGSTVCLYMYLIANRPERKLIAR